MAMSIDGFIAKEDDSTPWSELEWESYFSVAKQFKAIILGRRTYELMKEDNTFEQLGNPFTIILSRKKQKAEENGVVVSSPEEAIKALENKGIQEALLCGGSETNAAFLNEDLIDEIIIDVEPLIFGGGIKIFSSITSDKTLRLKKVQKIQQMVQLHYEVIHANHHV